MGEVTPTHEVTGEVVVVIAADKGKKDKHSLWNAASDSLITR